MSAALARASSGEASSGEASSGEAPTTVAAALSGKGGGDENFPVASRLVAARHRPVVAAFYRFARAADDVADHPALTPEAKRALLDRLEGALTGAGPADPEAAPLRAALAGRGMSPRHPLDLLVAFRRDVDQQRYATWDDLLDYCTHSAAPVGRFVLDVHGESEALWPANDALCAALQVINHLQDCAKDRRALDRVYLPLGALTAEGARVEDLDAPAATPALRAALRDLAGRCEGLLAASAPFAARIRDPRLALEVAVIQRLAEALTRRLLVADPLSERVHLPKARALLLALAGAGAEGARRLLRGAAR